MPFECPVCADSENTTRERRDVSQKFLFFLNILVRHAYELLPTPDVVVVIINNRVAVSSPIGAMSTSCYDDGRQWHVSVRKMNIFFFFF